MCLSGDIQYVELRYVNLELLLLGWSGDRSSSREHSLNSDWFIYKDE